MSKIFDNEWLECQCWTKLRIVGWTGSWMAPKMFALRTLQSGCMMTLHQTKIHFIIGPFLEQYNLTTTFFFGCSVVSSTIHCEDHVDSHLECLTRRSFRVSDASP